MAETLFIALCGGIIGYLIGAAGNAPSVEVIELQASEPPPQRLVRQRPSVLARPPVEPTPADREREDALAALMSIGYKRSEVLGPVRKADSLSASEIIREVQRKLARPSLFA